MILSHPETRNISIAAMKVFVIVKKKLLVSGVRFKMNTSLFRFTVHWLPAELQWIASGPDAFGCGLSLKNRSKRSN